MPWKLILFLLSLLAATLFIGFNLDNKCDVSWIFGKFTDVPIFVSILFSFTAGVLVAIPFKLRNPRRNYEPGYEREGKPNSSGKTAKNRGTKGGKGVGGEE